MNRDISSGLFRDFSTVIEAGGPEARKYLGYSAVMMAMTSVLDAIGVGAIIPFVALISLPDLFDRYLWLREWVPEPLQQSRTALIFVGVAVFALIYCLRAAATLASAWLQAELQGVLTLELSDRLFGVYLQRSYAFHLEKGPSFFSARLDDAVSKTRTAVQAAQQFGVETLTGLLILAIVVAVNPFAAAISVMGMAIPAAITYRYLHHRLQRLGEGQHLNWERGVRLLHTGISAIKDIKVFGREPYFHQGFVAQKREARILTTRTSLFSNAPRVLIELASVLVVLLLCVALTWQGRLEELLLVMGLYATAAFRLMPCANRLLMALTQMRQSRYGLALVADDLRARHEDAAASLTSAESPLPANCVQTLQFDEVSFRYRSDLPLALDKISLTIAAGESIGFVGSSGAGKSTLIDVLLGLLKTDAGEIRVDGENIERDLRAWRRRIGYVPQAIYLIDDNIRRNIAFGMADDAISDDQVWQALDAARLKDFVAALPEGLDAVVGERGVKLSGGQRQRVGIARALYHKPEILILDEATSALDNATEAEFMQAIDALHGKKTILMVAHRLSTIRQCDRIVVLGAGRIVEIGSYDELARDSETFGRIAGTNIAESEDN